MGMLKWLFISFVVVGLGAAVLVLALAQTDDGSPAPVAVDLTAIRDLANVAGQDANNMERHADAMVAIVAARPEHAHLAREAKTIRADARALRFLADSARAIDRDQVAFPVTASAVQLDRLQGDGLNLQGLGQTAVDHATAMETRIEEMRQEAPDDPELLDSLADLSVDVQRMKADGEAAINAGKAIEERARTIARSIGIELD